MSVIHLLEISQALKCNVDETERRKAPEIGCLATSLPPDLYPCVSDQVPTPSTSGTNEEHPPKGRCLVAQPPGQPAGLGEAARPYMAGYKDHVLCGVQANKATAYICSYLPQTDPEAL